jgi:hypothetical protein
VSLLKFPDLQSDFLRVSTLRDSCAKSVSGMESDVSRLEAESETLSRVSDLFRALMDKEVIDNSKVVERLLTEGLQAVFDDVDLSVRSEVDVKRGKVSVDLITVQKHPDGTVTEGSCTEIYGGSVSTVESVILRIVVLTRRGLRPLLLLDESLAAVAEGYVPRIGTFLSLMSRRMGVDILAVSHNPTLIETSDTSYRISKKNGKAAFQRVRES